MNILNEAKVNYWSGSSSWSSEKSRRLKIFKELHPDALMCKDGEEVSIKEFDSWADVKAAFKFSSGTNPHIVGIQFKINGKLFDLPKIERVGGRSAGTNAIKMEKMVALAAILGIQTRQEIEEALDSEEKIKELASKTGITTGEIKEALTIIEDDSEYLETFLKVAINIRQKTPLSGDGSKYRVLKGKAWNAYKSIAARELSALLQQEVKADKWNPADVVFVKDGFNFASIRKELGGDLSLIKYNEKFAEAVKAGNIIPISIKQKADSIKGSRGITGELPMDVSGVKLRPFIELGEIAGVPLLVNYDENVITDDTTIQKKVISWIDSKGKEYVEDCASIAANIVEGSSIFYEASGTHFVEKFEDSKGKLILQSVIISLTSQAVWLKFDKAFVIARSKGNSIQLSVESERKGSTIKDKDSFFASLKSDHSYLLESYFLEKYPEEPLNG